MKKSVTILFVFILFLPVVSAIGLSPDMTYINFEPLKEGSFVIRILNTVDSEINASLHFQGELAKYFTPEVSSVSIKPHSSVGVNVNYQLPYIIETPGYNQVVVGVQEYFGGNGGVSAVLNVIAKIIVDVPYPYKYIEYSFDLKNINIEDNISINFGISNKGEENIFSVKPVVDVYYFNTTEKAGAFEAKSFALNTGAHKSAEIILPSGQLGTGSFTAEAYVSYDGLKTKVTQTNFTIGYKDVAVVAHTEKLLSGGIREFTLTLENKWNYYVEDVSLIVYLTKDDVPVTEKSFSHTLSMVALERVAVPVFLDLSTVTPGDYEAIVEIYYGGETKKETFTVSVTKGFEIDTGMIVAVIIILLIVLDIGWMIF